MTDPGFPAGLVRVRRLPRSGLFGRPVYEIETATSPDGASRRTRITSQPYPLLRPVLGWDEAILVVQRAHDAWRGGVGPWCAAFSGELSDE